MQGQGLLYKHYRHSKSQITLMFGPKVTAILLNEWILPKGGSAPAACAAQLFFQQAYDSDFCWRFFMVGP